MPPNQDETPNKANPSNSHQPSVKGFFYTILYYLVIGFIIFLVIGFLTDGYGTGNSGNDPSKECFNYEKPDGSWANSCDL